MTCQVIHARGPVKPQSAGVATGFLIWRMDFSCGEWISHCGEWISHVANGSASVAKVSASVAKGPATVAHGFLTVANGFLIWLKNVCGMCAGKCVRKKQDSKKKKRKERIAIYGIYLFIH